MVVSFNNEDNNSKSNLKYLTRCQYYGKLLDYEYVSEAMILKLAVYTMTEYFGGNTIIRVYVPTKIENTLRDALVLGSNYFLITAPYRVNFNNKYRHRVDMLINIFEEII